MDISVLEEIGLTKSEISVFIALLKLGKSPAGPIVNMSGLQNSVVHRAIPMLIRKGLISYVLEGKKKYYNASDPKIILNYIDLKKERIEKLLPELAAQQSLEKQKQNASIYRGARGLREILNIMLETSSREYYAYGGANISNEILGSYSWLSFHNKRTRKKIYAKLIFNDSLRWWGKKINVNKYIDIRYTEKEYEQLTETLICGEKVALFVYTDNPYGFLIEDKVVADSYKKFFEMMWKNSNK